MENGRDQADQPFDLEDLAFLEYCLEPLQEREARPTERLMNQVDVPPKPIRAFGNRGPPLRYVCRTSDRRSTPGLSS